VPVLLPLAFLLLLIPWIRRLQAPAARAAGGWQSTALLAATAAGAFHALTLEGLSLAGAIRTSTVEAVWLAGCLLLAVPQILALRREPRRFGSTTFSRPTAPEAAFLVLLGVLLGGLLLVAWVAPSNNVDSLLYHMARVVHWAQNESLRPYGTAYGHQLWNPPFAESLILSLRLLWGGDRPANLVQWAALVGALIGVSGVARLLGLSRAGRMLAVAFAAALPMAVLQATSTQNDLVTGFWLVAATYFLILDRKQPLGRVERVGMGVALGLGLLTKGTYYVYGAVVGVWYLITRRWRAEPRRAVAEVASIAACVVVLNLGYWSRNLTASGTPLGPAQWVAGHSTATLASLKPRLVLYLPRLLRSLAPHLAGPWQPLNAAIDGAVKGLYRAFGSEINTPILVWGWNHEDTAGNPLHLLLIGLTLVGLAVSPSARRRPVADLALAVTAAYLLMVLLIPPAITTVGVRLHLPLFLLWSPVFAAVAMAWLNDRWAARLSVVFLLLGFPWLLFNATRPVIGLRPDPGALQIPCLRGLGCTRIGSVFEEPPAEIEFANIRPLEKGYRAVAQQLVASGCRDVGLRIDSSDPEYPLWYLLEAPQSGFRIEAIYTTPDLSPLLDRTFQPCAIVCTICGDRTRLHGLGLTIRQGVVRLFQGDGFTWDEDG